MKLWKSEVAQCKIVVELNPGQCKTEPSGTAIDALDY